MEKTTKNTDQISTTKYQNYNLSINIFKKYYQNSDFPQHVEFETSKKHKNCIIIFIGVYSVLKYIHSQIFGAFLFLVPILWEL